MVNTCVVYGALCQNGGTCTEDNSDTGFACTCAAGYFGDHCEV